MRREYKILLLMLPFLVIMIFIIWFFSVPLSSLDEPTGTLCKLRGGFFQEEKHQSVYYFCHEIYKDGNKKCVDSDQCEGDCLPTKNCIEVCNEEYIKNKKEKQPNYPMNWSCNIPCKEGYCEKHGHSYCGMDILLEDGYVKYGMPVECD